MNKLSKLAAASGISILILLVVLGSPMRVWAQPSISVQPTNQTVLQGSDAVFTVTASGNGPFTYQWQFSGTNLPASTIRTVAGNGTNNVLIDGVATNVSLLSPYGMALDSSGNLYIAEFLKNRVRKVDTNGFMSTFAGTGNGMPYGGGFSGDGGPATNADMSEPEGLAFDAAGGLCISANNRIRRVDTNGIIQTIIGTGNSGFSGDGGPATNASFYFAEDVTFDSLGNMYIADSNNYRVRRVDTNGIVTTVAGNGQGGFSGDGGPATNATIYYCAGVTVDSVGNMYIADGDNYRVRKVDTNGIISTVAGGGTVTLGFPGGVAVDGEGNVFIADVSGQVVRKVDTNGVISTVAGNGTGVYSGDGGAPTNAGLANPQRVMVDSSSGSLFISNGQDGRIRKVSPFATLPNLILHTVGTNNTGNYTVIVTALDGSSATSSVATLTVVLPPTIVTQPASQTGVLGSNITFAVSVSGTAPFGYTWLFDGTNSLQTGTNSALTLTNLTLQNAGTYQVIITNAFASVTSSPAILTVAIPPSITTQPADLTAISGQPVTLAVNVAGTGPFTYQWQFNGTNLPNDIISTFAGTGLSGVVLGDWGPATNAILSHPDALAFDASGVLYVADYLHARVRKIFRDGIIATAAGNGTTGASGDGWLALAAAVASPNGVATDAKGNLYIAQPSYKVIRKVDSSGLITTFAGNGLAGSGGDGGPATNANVCPNGLAVDSSGNVYLADTCNNRIRMVDTNGVIVTVAGNGIGGYSGDGGAATNASLWSPTGLAMDSAGNLYIGDYNDYRVRRVDTNGVITTVVGNGSYGFSGDGGAATNAAISVANSLVTDAYGALYFTDTQNQRVRRVDAYGNISTLAGNGTAGYAGDGGVATNAALYSPQGIALDSAGNIYVGDSANQRIRKISAYASYPNLNLSAISTNNAGTYSVVITTPYGAITSRMAVLTVVLPPIITTQPVGQVVSPGTNALFSVVATGTPALSYSWYFGGTNLLPAGTNSTLTLSNVGPASAGDYTVVVTNLWGAVTSSVASLQLALPPSVQLQPVSQTVLSGDSAVFSVNAGGPGPFTYQWLHDGTNVAANTIATVAGNGSSGYSGDGGPATNAMLFNPNGTAVDRAGALFIADRDNHRVRKVDLSGNISTIAGNGLAGSSGDGGFAINAALMSPTALAFDPAGNLFVCDSAANRIRKINTQGIITTFAGNGVARYTGDWSFATNAGLWSPQSVAVDASGNVFIADAGNNCIRMVFTNGIIATIAGNGSAGFAGDGGLALEARLSGPSGVAVARLGNIYIADTATNRVRIIQTNGVISSLAGNGQPAYSGDGGPALSASLNQPVGLAVDAFTNLLVADRLNNRIRNVDAFGIIATSAGNGSAFGPLGDGGPPTSACIAGPTGVTLGRNSDFYIADQQHNRIRKATAVGTYPVLSLANPSLLHAGNYSVIISNSFGSVTSTVAVLTVVIPPTITGLTQHLDNSVTVRFTGTPNYPYALWATTNLNAPIFWAPVSTNTTAADGSGAWLDSNAGSFPARFYRGISQ